MKRKFLLLATTVSCFCSVSAFAFPPTVEFGAGTFIATKACPELGINANDEVNIDADYTHIEVSKGDSSSQSGFKTLLKFSIPGDGTFAFRGPIGQQSANEFETNTFSGEGIYYLIKGDDTTGNATITNDKGSCLLTNNTGG
jgi:hypothetical protein